MRPQVKERLKCPNQTNGRITRPRASSRSAAQRGTGILQFLAPESGRNLNLQFRAPGCGQGFPKPTQMGHVGSLPRAPARSSCEGTGSPELRDTTTLFPPVLRPRTTNQMCRDQGLSTLSPVHVERTLFVTRNAAVQKSGLKGSWSPEAEWPSPTPQGLDRQAACWSDMSHGLGDPHPAR